MSAAFYVISNCDILSRISAFLPRNDILKLNKQFRIHSIIVPTTHTLLYGQVQCGKTSKIMEYVNNYKPDLLKIIIIQNNVSMLNQYRTSYINYSK